MYNIYIKELILPLQCLQSKSIMTTRLSVVLLLLVLRMITALYLLLLFLSYTSHTLAAAATYWRFSLPWKPSICGDHVTTQKPWCETADLQAALLAVHYYDAD